MKFSQKWHASADEKGVEQGKRETLFFYDRILLFIKLDQKLLSKNALFCGFYDYYLKKHFSPLTEFKPNLNLKSHWGDFTSELKNKDIHPTL